MTHHGNKGSFSGAAFLISLLHTLCHQARKIDRPMPAFLEIQLEALFLFSQRVDDFDRRFRENLPFDNLVLFKLLQALCQHFWLIIGIVSVISLNRFGPSISTWMIRPFHRFPSNENADSILGHIVFPISLHPFIY